MNLFPLKTIVLKLVYIPVLGIRHQLFTFLDHKQCILRNGSLVVICDKAKARGCFSIPIILDRFFYFCSLGWDYFKLTQYSAFTEIG